MNLSAKVAANTAVQFLAKAVSIVFGLLTIALVTRYLGQAGFGEYTAAMTFLMFFGIAADLGLTLVTVQIISRPGTDQDKAMGNLMALRLVSAVACLALAPLAVQFLPYSRELKTAVAIVTASFVFTSLNQVMVGLFQKSLRMDKAAAAEVGGRVLLFAGTALAIRYDAGLYGIMAVTVAANGFHFLLHWLFARSLARIRLRFDLEAWRGIIAMSWPLAATIVLNLVYLRADTLLLSLMPRDSEIGIIAEVGVYGAAYKVIDVLITFPFIFAGIILPILSAAWSRGDKARFFAVLQKSHDAMAMLAIPMIVGTQFIAADLMVLIAGADFGLSGLPLRILSGAAGAIFLGVMWSHAVIAVDRQKRIIGAYGFVAATALLGYLYAIPRFSLAGAAWVTVYSELAIALFSYLLAKRSTGFRFDPAATLKALAASLLMAAFIWGIKGRLTDHPAAIAAAAAPVYLAGLYLFKAYNGRDFKRLISA